MPDEKDTEENPEPKSVTITPEPASASFSSTSNPAEAAAPPQGLRCQHCGYDGPMPTVWSHQVSQLWIMCPRCQKGVQPLLNK